MTAGSQYPTTHKNCRKELFDMSMGSAVMIALAGLGVKFEREIENTDGLVVYISVPEHSYQFDANGVEMAGTVLARRYKRTMEDMGVKRLTVKSRTRSGETWTRDMRATAELDMKKHLFGSQH